jgi:nudix-type nucleoside diphosphatase (YffH/AdpP family)
MADEILSERTIHEGWLNLKMATVRLKEGEIVEREIVEHPSGAAVLPYDPERRVAMFISECRPPVLREGADRMIEVIAGALDGDDPPECARREALEEAGLQLSRLEPVAETWATPATSTERVTSFLARYSRADRVSAGGGLDEEAEHLRVFEIPLRELRDRMDAGEIQDAKTLLLLQALRIREPVLFE